MVIIDASIANKLFLLGEKGQQEVKLIFRQHTLEAEKILVPDFIFLEVVNTLVTKIYIPESKISRAISQLYSYNLQIQYLKINTVKRATGFAKKYNTSVYDAIYAVLAQENRCTLITADEKFAKQVNLPFIKTLASIS